MGVLVSVVIARGEADACTLEKRRTSFRQRDRPQSHGSGCPILANLPCFVWIFMVATQLGRSEVEGVNSLAVVKSCLKIQSEDHSKLSVRGGV